MDLFFDSTFWVEWSMLAAVLGIGLWVSLVDISTRRVPNKWTYSLLSIGLLGQGFMLITEVTTPARLAGVFGISLIIAMVLMVIRFWGPGDGKLFWATALALPPSLCPTFQVFSLQNAGPALLINTLFIYLLFSLFVSLFFRRNEEEPRVKQKEIETPILQVAVRLIGLLGLVLGTSILVMKRPFNYLEALTILVIGYRLFDFLLSPRHWPLLTWPGLGVFTVLCWNQDNIVIYATIWANVWLLELAYKRVRAFYRRKFVHSIPIGALQIGNVLHQSLYVNQGRESTPFDSNAEEEPLLKRGQPILSRNLRALRRLVNEKVLSSEDRIEIEHTLPFVPFITLGALLTALVAGHIATPLSRSLGRLVARSLTIL
ncbi:MAG: hypothetical protein F4Y79_07745 [Gemmatimonadetes bacterium]|nr:hypothetical protein [Gemmatimonadota bacterium]